MASELVMVNGLPGSGKTTLAVALAASMNAQLLSKDAVKEALAAGLEDPTLVASLGAIAMDAVWALAAALPGTVLIESGGFGLATFPSPMLDSNLSGHRPRLRSGATFRRASRENATKGAADTRCLKTTAT